MIAVLVIVGVVCWLWSNGKAEREAEKIVRSESQAKAVENTVVAGLWKIIATLFAIFSLLVIGVSILPHG